MSLFSSESARAHLVKVSIVFLVLLFCFLRLYKLPESLLFYNDMGRDFIALLNWSESGKPPLLGPQTSVLSYNQTAWYFYLLYPVFLISDHSAFSSTYTVIIVTTALLLALLYVARKNRSLTSLALISFGLLAIHPQVVLQNRFVWNPSFLPIFLLTATLFFFLQWSKYNRFYMLVTVLLLAFACGFSYSAVPFAGLLFLYAIIKHRSKLLEIVCMGVAAATLVFLPTIAFEIRHEFTLTKLALVGQTTPQAVLPFLQKYQLLAQYLFPAPNNWSNYLFLLFCGCILYGIYFYAKSTQREKRAQYIFLSVSFLVLLLATFILPIALEKHYIFPLLTLVVLLVARLPQKLNYVLPAFFALIWLNPAMTQQYFGRPVRTVAEMQSCYQQFCDSWKYPAYVSMESGVLVGYHNALDHQFFLREAGCQILDIEKTQDQANHMIVIGDNANYTHDLSAYHELTLFGNAQQIIETSCTETLKIYVLEKE